MFNGPEYNQEKDFSRLKKQHERIKNLMLDGVWRTLTEIEELTSDPAASISAQLRHLRKEKFGGWVVERRRRDGCGEGLYEYKLLPPSDNKKELKTKTKFSGKLFGKNIYVEAEDTESAILLLKLIENFFDRDMIKTERNTLIVPEY